MQDNNNFGRLLLMLLLTLGAGLAMYYLPAKIEGIPLKRVDLLSDLRDDLPDTQLDSLIRQLEAHDTIPIDTQLVQLMTETENPIARDSQQLAGRDSLYRVLTSQHVADSVPGMIQDYAPGHTALERFFTALRRRNEMDRPVRVAFLGDSFIEGDILVADFRELLQQQFGGSGAGFIPIATAAPVYRPHLACQSKGWTVHSLLNETCGAFSLSGLFFTAADETASFSVQTTDRYPHAAEASVLELLYDKNKQTGLCLMAGGDTLQVQLPPAETIAGYRHEGRFSEAALRFTQTDGFGALGVVMEDRHGISVDNFSLRGNTGLPMVRLDSAACRQWSEVRPYDLIILQYGLNVVADSMLNYSWYVARMEQTVQQLRRCFPETDILLLSVSDRGKQLGGSFGTMPEVLAMVHAQRRLAKRTGVAFWNTFEAMGGLNSMARYVDNNWASKDYTHLSFRGGKELAGLLYEALMQEKEWYDELEKMDN